MVNPYEKFAPAGCSSNTYRISPTDRCQYISRGTLQWNRNFDVNLIYHFRLPISYSSSYNHLSELWFWYTECFLIMWSSIIIIVDLYSVYGTTYTQISKSNIVLWLQSCVWNVMGRLKCKASAWCWSSYYLGFSRFYLISCDIYSL